MRDDICKDLIRHDWEKVKEGFEKLGKTYYKPSQDATGQKAEESTKQKKSSDYSAGSFDAGSWIYSESMAAVRIIERTLNYELTYEQALADIGDFYRKSGVVIAASAWLKREDTNYGTLGESIDNLTADLEASKQPNSPRLGYLGISRYLEAAYQGFARIEKQIPSWEMQLPDVTVDKLRKEIVALLGDKAQAKYKQDEEIQKSIYGAILMAQAAAEYVTGCVDYKLAKRSYKDLRIVLHEVRSIYCRILCLTRNFGSRVQRGVADNVRIAIIEVARFLELAFRTFEGIRIQGEDCTAELRVAWAAISTQVVTLQTEITRWSNVQVSLVAASWQSCMTALTSYTQEAATQIALLQGMGTCGDFKAVARIGELTNLVDDCAKELYCMFEHNHDFRMEVFDGFWEWLIEIRCSLACYYREEREEHESREEQLARFFQLFDFLKNSSATQASGAAGGASSPPPPLSPSPVTASSGTAATPTPTGVTTLAPQLPAYWATAQTLIANLKALSPRLPKGSAETWMAQAKGEMQLLQQGPARSNIPADMLFSRTQQEWNTLFAQLSVAVAIEKDADVCKKRPDLDKFAADLALLNQKMLNAFGQPVQSPVTAATTGGALS